MNQWANAVLTEKGATLLAKLTQGNALNITEAITGSGFVTPGLLVKQTEIVNPQQTLKFNPATYPEEGKCKVTVSLTNEGLTSGYSATQVGIFAADPDDGEILFIITQAQDAQKGTIVPSETEMPGYAAEWVFYFAYGQADMVNVTVDPAGAVSRAEFEEKIKKCATLDDDGKVPEEQLPDTTYIPVTSEVPSDSDIWIDPDETAIEESHVTDRNNPHGVTIAQIGAAPAGYGLGENIGKVAPSSATGDYDANEIITSGFWRAKTNCPTNGWWSILHIAHTDDYATQYAFAYWDISAENSGTDIKRYKYKGVWNPWEYVNPPMVFDVEYRTTERYKGLPVYTMLKSVGTLPNTTSKEVQFGTSATNHVRSEFVGTIGPQHRHPDSLGDISDIYFYTGNSYYVKITTKSDASTKTAIVRVWYTKD